jgi:hypothetical protein
VDYVNGGEITITQALVLAKKSFKGFRASQVIDIGVDTTGSRLITGKKDQPNKSTMKTSRSLFR